MRTRLSGLLVAALLVTGCSLLDEGPGGAREPAAPAGEPAAVAADFARTLEGLGIDVVDGEDPGALAGSVLAVTRIEAEHLGAEVEHGNGILGASLDEVIPMPPQAPPFSYLVGAWIDVAETPRARTAAAWFPDGTDWTRSPQVLFPRAALHLFVADNVEAAARDLPVPERVFAPASARAAAGAGGVVTVADLASAPCTLVKDQFTALLTGIFDALRIDPASVGTGAIQAVSGFLAGLWNHAVGLAEGVVRGLITTLTRPILLAIAEGVAIALIVVRVSSYLFGYSPEVRAVPDEFTMPGFPDDALGGSWELVRDARYEQVDKPLKDCVEQLPGDFTMPPVFTPGTPVQWTTSQTPTANTELLTYDPFDMTSRVPEGEGRIALPFSSGPDTERGAYTLGVAVATARLQRSELKALHALADSAISKAIAGVDVPNAGIDLDQTLKAALKAKLAPLQDELRAHIDKATASVFVVSGTGRALVRHREPEPPEPGGPLPCWWGAWRMDRTPAGLPADYWDEWSFVITQEAFSMRVLGFENVVPGGGPVGYRADWVGGTPYTAVPIQGRGVAVSTPRRQMRADQNGAAWGFDGLPLRRQLIVRANRANQFAFGLQFTPRRFVCLQGGARLRVTGVVDSQYPFTYTLARTG